MKDSCKRVVLTDSIGRIVETLYSYDSLGHCISEEVVENGQILSSKKREYNGNILVLDIVDDSNSKIVRTYCKDSGRVLSEIKTLQNGETTQFRWEYCGNKIIRRLTNNKENYWSEEIETIKEGGTISRIVSQNSLGDYLRVVDTWELKEGVRSRLIKSIHKDKFDNIVYKLQNTYNSNGDLETERIEQADDWRLTNYRFDSQGRLVYREALSKGGTVDQSHYKYNDGGLLVEDEYVYGVEKTISKYEYDVNGNKTHFVYLRYPDKNIDVSEKSETHYKYDQQGHLIEEKTGEHTIARKYDALGRVIEQIESNNNDSWCKTEILY